MVPHPPGESIKGTLLRRQRVEHGADPVVSHRDRGAVPDHVGQGGGGTPPGLGQEAGVGGGIPEMAGPVIQEQRLGAPRAGTRRSSAPSPFRSANTAPVEARSASATRPRRRPRGIAIAPGSGTGRRALRSGRGRHRAARRRSRRPARPRALQQVAVAERGGIGQPIGKPDPGPERIHPGEPRSAAPRKRQLPASGIPLHRAIQGWGDCPARSDGDAQAPEK